MALRLLVLVAFISGVLSSRLEGQHRHKKDATARKIFGQHLDSSSFDVKEVQEPLLEHMSTQEWRKTHLGHANWNEVEARTLRPLSDGFESSSELLEVDKKEDEKRVAGNESRKNASEWGSPTVTSTPNYAIRDCLEKVHGARGMFEGCRCKEGEEVFCGEKSISKTHTFLLSDILRECPDRKPACSKAEPICAQIAGVMNPDAKQTCDCPTGHKVFCGAVELHEGQSVPLAETIQKCQWNPHCALAATCETAIQGGTAWPTGEYPSCQCQDPMFELTCGDSAKDTRAHVFKLELGETDSKVTSVSVGGEACPYPKCMPAKLLKTKTDFTGEQDYDYMLTPPLALPSVHTSKHLCTQIEFNMRTLGLPVYFHMGLQGTISQDKKLKCYGLDLEVQLAISAGLHNHLRMSGVINALLNVSEIPLATAQGELEFKNDFDYEEKTCHSDGPWTLLRKSAEDLFKFWWSDVMGVNGFASPSLIIHAKGQAEPSSRFEMYRGLLSPRDGADTSFNNEKSHNDTEARGEVVPVLKRSNTWIDINLELEEKKESPVTLMTVIVSFKEKTWTTCEKFTKAEVVVWQELSPGLYKEEFSTQVETVVEPNKPKSEVEFSYMNLNKHKHMAMEVRMYRDGGVVCVAPALVEAKPEITSTKLGSGYIRTIWLGVEVLRYKVEGNDQYSDNPDKEQTLAVTKLTAKTANEGSCDRKLMSLELAINTGQRNGQQRAFWNPAVLGDIAPWGVRIAADPSKAQLPSDALKALIEKIEPDAAADPSKSKSKVLNIQHQTPEQLTSLLELGKSKGPWSKPAEEFEQWYIKELDHITPDGADRARREVLAGYLREVLHQAREDFRYDKSIANEKEEKDKPGFFHNAMNAVANVFKSDEVPMLDQMVNEVAERAAVEATGCARWATQLRPMDSPDEVAKKLTKCYNEALLAESKEPASVNPSVDESDSQHNEQEGDNSKEKQEESEQQDEQEEKEQQLQQQLEDNQISEQHKNEQLQEQQLHEQRLKEDGVLMEKKHQQDKGAKQTAVAAAQSSKKESSSNSNNKSRKNSKNTSSKSSKNTAALLETDLELSKRPRRRGSLGKMSTLDEEEELFILERPERASDSKGEFYPVMHQRQANPASCSLVHHGKTIYPNANEAGKCKKECLDLQKVVPKIKEGDVEVPDLDNRNFTNVMQLQHNSDSNDYLCSCFHCTDMTNFISAEGSTVTLLAEFVPDAVPTPREIVSTLTEMELASIMMGFTEPRLEEFVKGISNTSLGMKLWSRMVKDRLLVDNKLKFGAIDVSETVSLFGKLIAHGHDFLTVDALSESMNLRPVAAQANAENSAELVVRTEIKGETWEIHRQELTNTHKFNYLKEADLSKKFGSRWSSKLTVEFTNGEAKEECNVEVEIEFKLINPIAPAVTKAPNLIESAQAIFAAYDAFKGKLPEFADTAASFLGDDPVDPDRDMSDRHYEYMNGRFLHRDFQRLEKDDLKTFTDDLGKDNSVYNFARARSLSKYKNEKSFVFNTALSLANFFVRIVQDVQAMWNIYFAKDPYWGGQCSSLPTHFFLYDEMFTPTIADRATNWGKDQTMHINHANFAGVGKQGPTGEVIWKVSQDRENSHLRDEDKVWYHYPWIHKAKTGLSAAEMAIFFDESPPIHGKDGWATIDPTQLGAEMTPHIWCEVATQYFTQDTHQLSEVRKDALWSVMSGLRTLRSPPPPKENQTKLPEVKISYDEADKENSVLPQQRIAASPQDFIQQALLESLNKAVDAIREVVNKKDSEEVQCTDTRSEKLQTFYREMTLFSIAFGILEDIQELGRDVVLRGRMVIDTYLEETKPFKIPKGLKESKEVEEEQDQEVTQLQATQEFVDSLDRTLYTLREGLAQTKYASELQMAGSTVVHQDFIATLKLRGTEKDIEPAKLNEYAKQRAALELSQAQYQKLHHRLKTAIEGVVSLSQRVANWYTRLSDDVFKVEKSAFTGLSEHEETFQAAIMAASDKVQYAATMLNAFLVVGEYVSAKQRSIHTCFDEVLHHPAPQPAIYEPVVDEVSADRVKLLKDIAVAMDMAEVDENKVDGIEFFFEEHCMIPVNYGFEKNVGAPPTETRPECESAILSKALIAILPSFAHRSIKAYKKLYGHLNEVMNSLKEENSVEAALKNLDEMVKTLTVYLEEFDDNMDNDIYSGFAYRSDGSLLGELWKSLPDAQVKLAITQEERQVLMQGQMSYVTSLLRAQRQTNKAYPRVLTTPARKEEPCLCSKSWNKRVWFGNTLRQRGYQGCDKREFWKKEMWKDDKKTCAPAHWLDGEPECAQAYLKDCIKKPSDGNLPWFRVWYTTGINMKPVTFPIMSSKVMMHTRSTPILDFCRDSRPHRSDESWSWVLDSWIPWKLHRTQCKSWSVAPPAIKLTMDICRFLPDRTRDANSTNKTVDAHYTEFRFYSEYHLESWEEAYPKLANMPDIVERDMEHKLNLESCPGFDADGSAEKEGCTLNIKDQFAARTHRFAATTALIMDKLVSGDILKDAKGNAKNALGVLGEELWDILDEQKTVPWSNAADVNPETIKDKLGSDLTTMDFTVTDRNSTMVFSASKSFRPEKHPWPSVVGRMSSNQIVKMVEFIAPKVTALHEVWKARTFKDRASRFDAMSEQALRKGLIVAVNALEPSKNLPKVEQLLHGAGRCNAKCFSFGADPARGLSDGQEVLGYARKDLGSWMRVGYGDVLFGAGTSMWLTQHSDTWFYQLTHSGDESGAYFPDFYEGAELKPSEECKKTADLPHDLFEAADYTCLQTLAKKIDVDEAKDAWNKFIKDNCGMPPVEGFALDAGSDTSALPPGCASGQELARMLLASVKTEDAKKTLKASLNRGDHSAVSFEEESGLEQANTRPWVFKANFHSQTPGGESVKLDSAVVDFPFAWEKKIDFDFMPVIESLRARMPLGSVKAKLTALQAHREKVDECKRCVAEPEAHGFCDWAQAAKAMLGRGYKVDSGEAPCMKREAASRYKCEHFAVKSLKDISWIPDSWFPNFAANGSPGPSFAEEKCPCIGSGGQSVTPEWITTEEQCEELILPDEYFEQAKKVLKEEELASELRVARLALDVKLEPKETKYGCKEKYMCCETLTKPPDGLGLQDHLVCVHEGSIKNFLFGSSCDNFKSTTPGLEEAKWSSVAEPIRCMDQESSYAQHLGYWRMMGKHWIQNDRALNEEEAKARQAKAEEEAAAEKFEEIHRGCLDKYFCCKEKTGSKKGCFLEKDLTSWADHLSFSSGQCSNFEGTGPLEEMKLEALTEGERCEMEQPDDFSGFWGKVAGHWLQSKEDITKLDKTKLESEEARLKKEHDAHEHEKKYQGCSGEYFCCEKVEGGEKACYEEGSLKSGLHIAGAKCEEIKDYKEGALKAVEPKGRCPADAAYWKDVSSGWSFGKEWKRFDSINKANEAK